MKKESFLVVLVGCITSWWLEISILGGKPSYAKCNNQEPTIFQFRNFKNDVLD